MSESEASEDSDHVPGTGTDVIDRLRPSLASRDESQIAELDLVDNDLTLRYDQEHSQSLNRDLPRRGKLRSAFNGQHYSLQQQQAADRGSVAALSNKTYHNNGDQAQRQRLASTSDTALTSMFHLDSSRPDSDRKRAGSSSDLQAVIYMPQGLHQKAQDKTTSESDAISSRILQHNSQDAEGYIKAQLETILEETCHREGIYESGEHRSASPEPHNVEAAQSDEGAATEPEGETQPDVPRVPHDDRQRPIENRPRDVTMGDVFSFFRSDPMMTAWLVNGMSKSSQKQAKHKLLVNAIQQLLVRCNTQVRQEILMALRADLGQLQKILTDRVVKSHGLLHDQTKFINGVQKDLQKGFVEARDIHKSALSDILLRLQTSSAEQTENTHKSQDILVKELAVLSEKLGQILAQQLEDSAASRADAQLTNEKLLQTSNELAEARERIQQATSIESSISSLRQLLSTFQSDACNKIQGINDTCETKMTKFILTLSSLEAKISKSESNGDFCALSLTDVQAALQQNLNPISSALEELKHGLEKQSLPTMTTDTTLSRHDERWVTVQQALSELQRSTDAMETRFQEVDRLRSLNRELQEQHQNLVQERSHLQQDQIRSNSDLVAYQLKLKNSERRSNDDYLQKKEELAKARSDLENLQQSKDTAESRIVSLGQEIKELQNRLVDAQKAAISNDLRDQIRNTPKALMLSLATKHEELQSLVNAKLADLASTFDRCESTIRNIPLGVQKALESQFRETQARIIASETSQEQKTTNEFGKLRDGMTQLLDQKSAQTREMLNERLNQISRQSDMQFAELKQCLTSRSRLQHASAAAAQPDSARRQTSEHGRGSKVSRPETPRGVPASPIRPTISPLSPLIEADSHDTDMRLEYDPNLVEVVLETQNLGYAPPTAISSVLSDAVAMLNPSPGSSGHDSHALMQTNRQNAPSIRPETAMQSARVVPTHNPFGRQEEDIGSIVHHIANSSLQRQSATLAAHATHATPASIGRRDQASVTTQPIDHELTRPPSTHSFLRRPSRAVGLTGSAVGQSYSARLGLEWTTDREQSGHEQRKPLDPTASVYSQRTATEAQDQDAPRSVQPLKRKRESKRSKEGQTPSQRARTPLWSETNVSQRPVTGYGKAYNGTSFVYSRANLAAVGNAIQQDTVVEAQPRRTPGKLIRTVSRPGSQMSRLTGGRDKRADERIMAERFGEELRKPIGRPVRKKKTRAHHH